MNILTALKHQERIASRRGQLEEDRKDALDRYLGRPYGDEVEGRSQVVMRDVADTVEWIKPSLLKVFAAGDEVVRFNPTGPEDEEQSEQETDYVNHVFMVKNEGFTILHDWFHDALLQRNGYVMADAVKIKRSNRERFEGLSDDELSLVMQAEGVEILEHAETVDPFGIKTHSAVIRQIAEYSCVKVSNIPPERVLVAPDWPSVSLEGCPFVEVIDYKTISQLRERGFDVDDAINDENETDEEGDSFRSIDEDEDLGRDDIEADAATRRVMVRYVWMNYDEDGDGIAELRKLVVVGDTILENEEDDIIPVACLTPGRLPHEHIGQSVDDWVQDLQRIRTVLTRGMLDNMYLSMHPQTYVDATRVNMDDMLVSRIGGIRRTQGDPRTAVMEAVRPDTSAMTLQAIEYVDKVREARTGVNKNTQGLGPDILQTATQSRQIVTASQERIMLIARVFAETGVKQLMLIIHAMSIKHGRQQEMVKLRNKWVPIDPRGWKTRRDLTVSVGIGTGDKDQMGAHLNMIFQQQMAVMPMGVATPVNVYNTLRRLTQNAGFKQTEEFWTDISQQPPKPPQPDPKVQLEQAKMQADAQEAQAKRQDDAMRFQAETQMQMTVDQNRQQWEARQKEQELRQTAELEAMRAQYEDAQQRREIEFKTWFAQYDRDTKLMLAGIQSQDKQRADMMGMQKHADSREDAHAFKAMDDAKGDE